MSVHYHDFRANKSSESKPSAEALAALLEYVARDIDPQRFGPAQDLVIAAAQCLRMQRDQ